MKVPVVMLILYLINVSQLVESIYLFYVIEIVMHQLHYK